MASSRSVWLPGYDLSIKSGHRHQQAPWVAIHVRANQSSRSTRGAARVRRGTIVHGRQIKPLGRGDHAAVAAVARMQRGTHVLYGPFAGPHMFERAHDRTHLAMQKRPRARHDVNFFAAPRNIEPFQGAYWVFRLALRRAKRRKV